MAAAACIEGRQAGRLLEDIPDRGHSVAASGEEITSSARDVQKGACRTRNGFFSPQRGDRDQRALTFRESLRLARKTAGLDQFGFHDCRHHFISFAVMSGIDFMTIARSADTKVASSDARNRSDGVDASRYNRHAILGCSARAVGAPPRTRRGLPNAYNLSIPFSYLPRSEKAN
jgi:hypothetical protein